MITKLVHEHDLGAEGGHHLRPFRRVALRHHGHEVVALDRADDGEAGSGVAAGQLDHCLAWREVARLLSVLDHLAGDPVLLGRAWVEVVELDQDAPLDGFAGQKAGQLHQRGLPDGLQS